MSSCAPGAAADGASRSSATRSACAGRAGGVRVEGGGARPVRRGAEGRSFGRPGRDPRTAEETRPRSMTVLEQLGAHVARVGVAPAREALRRHAADTAGAWIAGSATPVGRDVLKIGATLCAT